MRKFIALTGALLLALPGLAFAQVKTQTKGGDWAAQPTAPGDFTRSCKLPQKIGDVTVNFRARADFDFQSNRNQDFDDDQDDSSLTPTTRFGGGNVGRNPGRKGEFFEYEDLRFGFDASGDRWAIHTVAEANDSIADRNGADSTLHVERWWGDYDFGYFNIRIGNQIVGFEPGAMVWTDDDAVLRLYKDYGTVAWSIYYSKRQDADPEVDAGQGGGAPTGGVLSSKTGTSNDQDVIGATLELAFANPIGAGTLSFVPFFVYQDDKRFQRPTGAAFAAGLTAVPAGGLCGITCDGDLSIYTAGATIAGKVGPVDAVIAGAYQWGEDNTGLNSINPATGVLQKADIAAWYAFANLAWAIPNTPLTIGAGVIVASGDDDPFDDNANGYLGVAQNTEFGGGLGGIDIWVDEFDTAIKLQNAALQTGNASNNDAIFLTTDDDPLPLGLSNVANVQGGPQGAVARSPASGMSSGSGAALDPNSLNNRSHPGIIFVNANLSYRVTKDLLTRVDVNPIWFYTGDGFHPFNQLTTATPSGASAGAGIDTYAGTEVVFTSLWRPWGSPYFSINPGVAVLIPGSGMEDLTGTDDIAVKVHVSFIWALGI